MRSGDGNPNQGADSAFSAEVEEGRACDSDPWVWLEEDQAQLAASLAAHLRPHGVQVFAGNGPRPALQPPTAVLIDLDKAESRPGILHQASNPTALVLASEDDLQSRLRAVRCGAEGLYVKPVDPSLLADRILRLTHEALLTPYRVLIVEDDEDFAAWAVANLELDGMRVEWVADPKDLLGVLDSFRPEVIVLDVELPTCSGLELARVIRQGDAYLGVPILFLSGSSASNVQHRALRSGADAYLNKSTDLAHLVESVRIRAARGRRVRAAMTRDSLTGLLNHSCTVENLKRESMVAKRNGRPLSFAMLDIDHFKSINDKYGHRTGDQVLRSLARVLIGRLRGADLIGRYGGEEFALILPGASKEDGVGLLEELRVEFNALEHGGPHGSFRATFSAGVAQWDNYDECGQFIEAADQMLYRAKAKGRNRVMG
ncbi:MAG: diguanylate cyclase [Chromatiales bacterium]|nr:diguanylate cyclase [Chromatiales bacterium]